MPTQTHAFRLLPGADLRKSILAFVAAQNIMAGWIACGVGSLTRYNIRFADRSEGTTAEGHFEIVSLIGTLSKNGSHLHISVSDPAGTTIGGHLLDGNLVYTTVEIVIQSTSDLVFTREKDGSTPWEELKIEKRDEG